MAFRNSSFGKNGYAPVKWDFEKQIRRTARGRNSPYSPGKGAIYSFIFAISLWWLPVAGPAIAGYLSGRRAGSSSSALQSSLIVAAVMTFLTFALLPIKGGPVGLIGGYLSTGVAALAQSPLTSSSTLFTDLYTGYGLIRTFALIIPSSLVTLVVFSYVGGTYSEFKSQEHLLVDSKVIGSRTAIYERSKNTMPLKVRTTGIEPWIAVNDNGDEDGYDLTSLD